VKRLWLILLVLLGTAIYIPRVLAHADLVSAEPAPGSTVATLTELRLTFSEPISANGQIDLHQNFISAAVLIPVVENETELVTAVPTLPDGAYTVQWSVTSADGHPISGSYSLGIDSRLEQPAAPWYRTAWVWGGVVLMLLLATAVWLRRKQPA
jgi:methionine-rich copper-binding protein CopC